MDKNGKLDQLFVEWRERYESHGMDVGGFCPDGIIDEPRYESSKFRILFILRETNKAPGTDLRCLLRQESKWSPWWMVSRWSYGLLNDFRPFERLAPNVLHDTLREVAVMNLKKITGTDRVNWKDFNDALRQDVDLIRREVDIIDPQVIVSCGNRRDVARLFDLDDVMKDDSLNYSRGKVNEKEKLFFYPRHPSHGASSAKTYAQLKASWQVAHA